jgi:hypothetical protein
VVLTGRRRKGLTDMVTAARPGITCTLVKTLRTSTPVESKFSIALLCSAAAGRQRANRSVPPCQKKHPNAHRHRGTRTNLPEQAIRNALSRT